MIESWSCRPWWWWRVNRKTLWKFGERKLKVPDDSAHKEILRKREARKAMKREMQRLQWEMQRLKVEGWSEGSKMMVEGWRLKVEGWEDWRLKRKIHQMRLGMKGREEWRFCLCESKKIWDESWVKVSEEQRERSKGWKRWLREVKMMEDKTRA